VLKNQGDGSPGSVPEEAIVAATLALTADGDDSATLAVVPAAADGDVGQKAKAAKGKAKSKAGKAKAKSGSGAAPKQFSGIALASEKISMGNGKFRHVMFLDMAIDACWR
jgi:hypothetical protein